MQRGMIAILVLAALASPLAQGTPKAEAQIFKRIGQAIKRGWEDAKRFVERTSRRAGQWVKKAAQDANRDLRKAVDGAKYLLQKAGRTIAGTAKSIAAHSAAAAGLLLGRRLPNNPRCGGLGQRACCVGEQLTSCNKGLKEIAGCNGDCNCGIGSTFFSNGMCTKDGPIDEPVPGWTPPKTPAGGLRGYADVHMHLFGHLAHGGRVHAGKPYDAKGGINKALQPCNTGDHHMTPHRMTPFAGNASTLASGTKDNKSLLGRAVDSAQGAPSFNGWPTWRSTIHEQVYYKWLERAWRGGLRLIVQLAVTNEALCRGTRATEYGENCEDGMRYIDKQIRATTEMEKFIDGLHGGQGKGWFKVVTTPQEARRAILAGKLAVVQGIEVDNLFNCKLNKAFCDSAYVRRKVDEYYQKGVRHILPIHNFDNSIGGSATWQDTIEVGNKVVEGSWWQTENCPKVAYSDGGNSASYGFRLGHRSDWFDKFVAGVSNFAALHMGFSIPGAFSIKSQKPLLALVENLKREIPTHNEAASCNTKGLTPTGEELVQAMMDRGMIIDVDHMSRRSLRDTFVLANARDYPIVASHVQFFDLNQQQIRHERMRTRRQLEAIRHSGGMIGAMLKDDVQDTDNIGKQFAVAYVGKVDNNCRHSSKTWAQMLQYAVDVMGTEVAMGSDFNGVAGHLGPRFGSDACGADPNEQKAQKRKLIYPFTLKGFGKFTRQKTGHRTFDFNFDGLAHVGLVPDLVADVQTSLRLPKRYIDKLFGSAEKYIQVWEKALMAREGPIFKNLALLRPARQSGTYDAGGAVRAVDGGRDGNSAKSHSVTHTPNVSGAWWQVDLEGDYPISEIRIYNRTDCCADRLKNFKVIVKASSQPGVWSKHYAGQAGRVTVVPVDKTGRFVRIQLGGENYLSLAEVEVLGRPLGRATKMEWVGVPGKLVRMAVGSASHVWGVNAAGQVFHWAGGTWHSVGFPKKAADIGAGPDGSVWAVSTKDEIFELTGWGKGAIWRLVPGRLTRIAVGGAGQVWGINRAGNVYRWTRKTWTHVPGKLEELGIGADGTVWGVSPAGAVLRLNGITWSKMKMKMPTTLNRISVGSAKHVWGLNRAGQVWRWNGTEWKRAPGALAHIGVGVDGSVWGTNSAHNIWRLRR